MPRTLRVAGVILLTWAILPWFGLTPSVHADAPEIDFSREIQPILARRCYKCHGPDKAEGGLRLHENKGALAELESGEHAIIPSDLKHSVLLQRIASTDEFERMPPEGKPLTADEIDSLRRWIAAGAPWAKHWSFRPVQRPAAPQVKNKKWVRAPIDAFILHRLEEAGLQPAPPAEKTALLRRAYYDLTGLPPSPREVRTFLEDDTPDAFERVVDRLLDSPQYGERWGRHWLDLVHYAESNSFERDNPKPEVWRYRDYVIRAFNEDKPYDQFVQEQLAGDEVENVTADSVIATGYYRLGLWDDESSDPLKTRYDELDDFVTTTAQVMLGLTINCARCHDHKLDPIPQTDYYRFLAFFNGVRSFQNSGRKGFANGNFLTEVRSALSPELQEKYKQALDSYDKRSGQLRDEIAKIENEVRRQLKAGVLDDFAYESNRLPILREYVGKVISQQDLASYETLRAELEDLDRIKSTANVKVLSAKGTRNPPETFVLARGNPLGAGEKVEPGYPSILDAPPPVFSELPPDTGSSGRRLTLSRWMTSPENPLASRVIVNRVWQHHFGRGIVRSSSNFGHIGDPPTHPQLLDWLASEFVAQGWKFKSLHRLIMLSSAYQMSSQGNDAALAKDPTNNLLWRFDMRRLSAEEIRDSILAVNGKLNLQMGGPSIYPEIPKEVLAGQSKPGQNWKRSSPEDQARRSVYIHVKRSLLVPILETFDFADTDTSCPVRFVTTQPTQALTMLNSKFLQDGARTFAARLRKETPDNVDAQIQQALELATGREPTSAEVRRGRDLIQSLQTDDGLSADAALDLFCLTVLNLNEFVYLD